MLGLPKPSGRPNGSCASPVGRPAPAESHGASRIVTATRYTPVNIHVKAPRQESIVDWINRELKDGGFLQTYLAREKALGPKRLRAVARQNKNFQQNMKSELELKCVLPAREFFRLREMDPHFFEDKQNIKNLIRDTPEVQPWKA